jgi:hypothetical protein
MVMSTKVAEALWQAWMELNEIRARDGIPYTHQGWKASVDEKYFSQVVDDCAAAYQQVTGREIKPWHPKFESKP